MHRTMTNLLGYSNHTHQGRSYLITILPLLIPYMPFWLAPNFKLRVGDYRTRLEAEKMLHELRTAYPGCFVVPDEVEMPRL